MSVYKRGKKGLYQYDFWLEGHRFLGTTGKTTEEDALRFEKKTRKQAMLDLAAGKIDSTEPLTFDKALGQFWIEVGDRYKGTYRQTVETALEWLLEKSGIEATTLIRNIGPAKLTGAIARRRGEGVADATVNRTVTEILRRILIRARDHWEQQVQRIEWDKYLLDEPKERIKSLKSHEEPKLLASLAERDDYLPAILFKMKSGFRKREVVSLKKNDIDWGNRTISVIGKGDKPATVPLSSELREILWPLQNHPTDYVFTFVAQHSVDRNIRHKRKDGTVTVKRYRYTKGERYQITYSGLATAWRRFGPSKAGIEDFHLHDLRHTAATRLAKGGKANIKIVQKLMRHEDIATTAKYMAVYDEDVVEAMEAETKSRDEVPQILPQVTGKKA